MAEAAISSQMRNSTAAPGVIAGANFLARQEPFVSSGHLSTRERIAGQEREVGTSACEMLPGFESEFPQGFGSPRSFQVDGDLNSVRAIPFLMWRA